VPALAPADACPFAPRCPHAIDVCMSRRPVLESTGGGTVVACHRWRELGVDVLQAVTTGGRG
jgi:ABC-type dipeptide/oligopeptide/nickel transport system ATPase component